MQCYFGYHLLKQLCKLIIFGTCWFFISVWKDLALSMNAGIWQPFCYYIIAGNVFQEVQPCLHAVRDSCCALLVFSSFLQFIYGTFYCLVVYFKN